MESKLLIDYLLQFGSLNQQQIALIDASVTVRHVKAGDYFLRAGKISNEVGFVTNGVLRVIYYQEKGEEITRYFVDESSIVVDMQSFSEGIPTMAYVQAVIDSELLVLSKEAMDNLSNTIINWDKIWNKVTIKALAEKVGRISMMFPQDATERYNFFLEKFPNLANRIPLQYIASYIGITKHSLSRIRGAVNKKS